MMVEKLNGSRYDEDLNELLKQLKKSYGVTLLPVKTPSTFFRNMHNARGKIDKKLIADAFYFAKEKHVGQKRVSGKSYFTHLYSTALILAQLGADSETIAAGLLHDILEDTDVSKDELREKFGEDVCSIVLALTKWRNLSYSKNSQAIHYLQRLLLSSTADLRVVLVKLADKLHNVRTLKYLSKAQQKRISKLSLEVYAPLAHKIGLHELENEIEELCFPLCCSKQYRELKPIVDKKRKKQVKTLLEVKKILQKESGPTKKYGFSEYVNTYYDIFHTLSEQNPDINQIHNFVSLVVLTDSVSECYEALYLIHKSFAPVPGTFFDYIALPQFTYHGLHTIVISPKGGVLQIRIRTKEMNELANKGILLWIKDKKKMETYGNHKWNYLKQIASPKQPTDFFESLKKDFLGEEIIVFGVNGRICRLPFNSTVIGFAYECPVADAKRLKAATINGQTVPLWHVLSSGDIVQLFFDKEATVKEEWLDFVNSPKVKKQILKDLKKYKKKELKSLYEYSVNIFVQSKDRSGLLADLCHEIAKAGLSIDLVSQPRKNTNIIGINFQLKVKNKKQAEDLVKAFKKVKGVLKVTLD